MKKKLKTNKVLLRIEGMHCSSCAMSIDFDLEDLEGVKTARTSYAKQESEVEFDREKVEMKTIVETIQKVGYTAKIITD